MYIMLDDMYVTMSISTGLYPNLDLWTANKLQLQCCSCCSGQSYEETTMKEQNNE